MDAIQKVLDSTRNLSTKNKSRGRNLLNEVDEFTTSSYLRGNAAQYYFKLSSEFFEILRMGDA